MIVPLYAPGDWFAVVTDGSIALLPPSTDHGIVQELWEQLREGGGLTEQVHLLLRDGIAQMPPFALVSVEGGSVHAIVRGGVEVDVRTDDGTRVLSAARVSTWTEEIVAGARTVAVRSPGWDGISAGGALPALSAVVRAAGVRVELDVETPAAHRVAPQAGAGAESDEHRARRTAPTGPARREREPVPAGPRDRPWAGKGLVTEVLPALAPDPAPVPASPSGHAADPHLPALGTPALATPAPATPAPATVAQVPAQQVPAQQVPAQQVPAQHVPDRRVPDRPLPARPVPVPASPASAGEVPAATGLPAEDHDGMTVLSSDVVALRRQLPDWAGDAVPGPLAVPAAQTPPPAKLLLSSGLVVSLNRPVLLGRAPQVSRVANREIPRLVTVASPNQDISRTHAEVRMEGEEVVVTDLRSTNGILLMRQGAGPQRLHPGEPTVVEPGVVVDLGEGVTFTVERGV